MKNIVTMLAVLGMIATLCAGCGQGESPESEATKVPAENSDENWAPEAAKQPAAHDEHDGSDHSGHNH